MKRKPLSRRTFLRGAGGVAIALPFLEAMLPPMATANTTSPKRYVVSFCGTSCGANRVSDPGSYGPLAASLPMSWKALEPVRQHVSLVSNTVIPTYPSSQTTPGNASSIVQQHGTTPAPMLAGVSSQKGMPVMVRAQTSDQFVADAIGQGTLYKSLQMRVQAIPYNGGRVDRDAKGIMSARGSIDNANALRPLVSPLEIYEKLFTTPSMPSMPGMPGTVDKTLSRRASILDLISEDSQRLSQRISGADRARMELHFTKIRELEQRLELQAQMMSGGGMTGGGGMMGSACGNLMHPGPDPAVTANVFGGWSDETVRGQLMADMIALCLSCDMTRAVSWMLSFDQVWLKNQATASGLVGTDMHETAHKQTNGSSPADQLAAAQITAENANWHAGLFARLVANLAQMPEGSATVLDNTFLALLFAEGPTAHSRVHMRHIVAGNGAHIKLGQHINGGGEHPGRLLISGMTSVGVQSDTMNQLSGGFSAIEV